MTFLQCFWFYCTDGDEEVAARLAPSRAVEAMLNGTECDSMRHKNLTGNNKTVLLINENGTSDIEPPHGSITGSNGFILEKQEQQEDSAAATADLGVSPHRTNRMSLGSSSGGHTVKPLPPSAPGDVQTQSSGSLRTATCSGTMSGQGTSDTKNGTVSCPASAPITIHRARKTMSRPAVSPAQKVNHGQEPGIVISAYICFVFIL